MPSKTKKKSTATEEEEINNCREITDDDVKSLKTFVNTRQKGSKIVTAIKAFAKEHNLSWTICRSRYYSKKTLNDETLPQQEGSITSTTEQLSFLSSDNSTPTNEMMTTSQLLLSPPQNKQIVTNSTNTNRDEYFSQCTRFENDLYRLIFYRLSPHVSFTIEKPTSRNRHAILKFTINSIIDIDSIITKTSTAFDFGSSQFKILNQGNDQLNLFKPICVSEYFDDSLDISTFKAFTVKNQEEKEQKFLVLSVKKFIEETAIPYEDILNF